MSDSQNMPTLSMGAIKGNSLFEQAVGAIALDDGATRWMLFSVLNSIGSKPEQLTADELGSLLPEVDRRLRKLLPDAQADAAIKRVYRVLFAQAESP